MMGIASEAWAARRASAGQWVHFVPSVVKPICTHDLGTSAGMITREMKSFGDRLKWARRAAGFQSSEEAALRHGWAVETYRSHEKGKRFPRRAEETLRTYARAFGVVETWLLTGRGSPTSARRVPLFGTVGAGETVVPVTPDNATMIDAPADLEEGAAVIVHGDSMRPVYRPGDVLFFSRRERPDYSTLHGQDCIVQLAEAEAVYVKTLFKGRKAGLYRLRSYATMQDMEDMRIDWAAPVEWVKRTGG